MSSQNEMSQSTLSANSRTKQDARSVGLFRCCSINDWLTFGYLLCLNAALIWAPAGPGRQQNAVRLGSLLAWFVLSVLIVARGPFIKLPWVRAVLYRIGHYTGLQLPYLAFASYLPVVNPTSLDRQLFDLDIDLFGVEPALLFDGFVSQASTEWFAFFYFSYFLIIAGHVFPILFFGKHQRLTAEFALGLTIVLCIGQATYVLVPGFGPHRAFPGMFENDLPSGLWWGLVTDLVATSGAHKDIFPSLHTAIPTFVLLFSFHNRAIEPYRYTWPVLAFVTLNIIVATMFLRWHYLIDVVAGLALATLAFSASIHLSPWESRRRSRLGLGPVWPSYTKTNSGSD